VHRCGCADDNPGSKRTCNASSPSIQPGSVRACVQRHAVRFAGRNTASRVSAHSQKKPPPGVGPHSLTLALHAAAYATYSTHDTCLKNIYSRSLKQQAPPGIPPPDEQRPIAADDHTLPTQQEASAVLVPLSCSQSLHPGPLHPLPPKKLISCHLLSSIALDDLERQ